MSILSAGLVPMGSDVLLASYEPLLVTPGNPHYRGLSSLVPETVLSRYASNPGG